MVGKVGKRIVIVRFERPTLFEETTQKLSERNYKSNNNAALNETRYIPGNASHNPMLIFDKAG